MEKEDIIYWIWLSLACKTGSVLPSTLLKYFGSPKRIYEATAEEFADVEINFYGHEKELSDKSLEKAQAVLKYCRKNDVGVMTPEDYFYPEKFRALPNKPIVLYYLGNFCDLDTAFVAGIVGTRHPSEYGIHAAKRMAFDLSRAGALICSGMAAGIDSAAHKAALYCGNLTIGVLGCGIDRVYPPENAQLYESVIQKGILITEYPPGTPPYGKNFPVRNRLIAALSEAVLVIEGSERSGALITAEYALKQKKALYAVPGSVFSALAAGSNFLLKIGAKPLVSAYDVVDDFKERYPALRDAVGLFQMTERDKEKKLAKKKTTSVKQKRGRFVFGGMKRAAKEKEPLPPQFEFVSPDEEAFAGENGAKEKALLTSLSEDERKIWEKLSFEPIPADKLVDGEYSASVILAILTKLEIKGLVKKAPGGKFILADRAED